MGINIQIPMLRRYHLLSASDLSKFEVLHYIHSAGKMRDILKSSERPPQYPDKTLITMFYEPSTRTNCSFQSAAFKLGCNVIALTEKVSSSEKGESLEDTIRTLQYYGDAIVLRHPLKGSAERASSVSDVPIINGGDGNGEHPTQALLDIFTIYTELQQKGINLDNTYRENITITFVGDLKNSRTVHSLIRLLLHFPKLRFIYVSPVRLEMPDEIVRLIQNTNQYEQNKSATLMNAIQKTDILYMTRIQKERFENKEEYRRVMANSDSFQLSRDIMIHAKENMIVMHPMPRLDEIPVDIDKDDRAVYFKQVENGLYMRMALLDSIFSQEAL